MRHVTSSAKDSPTPHKLPLKVVLVYSAPGLAGAALEFTETYGESDPDAAHLGKGETAPDKSSFSTLYPNLYFCNTPQFIEVGLVLPDGPEHSIDRRIYLMTDDAANGSQLDLGQDTADGFAAAGREDEAICEAVQMARNSPVYSQHFYSPFWDELHYQFTQLLVGDLTDE